MYSRDSLHVPEGYSTCISDNNKSRGRRRGLKTKTVKRLQVGDAIVEMEGDVITKFKAPLVRNPIETTGSV